MKRKHSFIIFLCGIAAALAAGFILHRFNPEHHFIYPRCPFFALTGLRCAGCGATRAAHLLLRGDLTGALAQNPLLFVALLFAVLFAFKPAWLRHRFWIWAVVAVVVAYTVWRNIWV